MRISIISLLLFLPTLAFTHSGGLDQSGGHNCYVGSCAGSYHYHRGVQSWLDLPTIIFFLIAAVIFVVWYENKDGNFKFKIQRKKKAKFIDLHPPFNSKTGKFEWNGEWKQYFENGQLMSEGFFSDGKAVGQWSEYYQNGSLNHEVNYDWHDAPQLESFYYDNGQLKKRGYNKNGYRIGEWEHYYKNGQLAAKRDEDRNKWNGKQISYHENGTISFQGNFKNGKCVGTHKRFFESGRLEEEQRFKNFETIYHKIFYEDGTLSMHIEKKSNGKDISRFYDRFGTLTKSYKD